MINTLKFSAVAIPNTLETRKALAQKADITPLSTNTSPLMDQLETYLEQSIEAPVKITTTPIDRIIFSLPGHADKEAYIPIEDKQHELVMFIFSLNPHPQLVLTGPEAALKRKNPFEFYQT